MVWKNSSNEVLEIFCEKVRKEKKGEGTFTLYLQVSSVESLCTILDILNLNL